MQVAVQQVALGQVAVIPVCIGGRKPRVLVVEELVAFAQFAAEMAPWLASGKIEAAETVVDGLERTPEAFLSLFTGGNTGKMLIKL